MPIPLEIVARIPLLQGLDDDTLGKLSSIMVSRIYLPNDTVMRKGSLTNNLGFLFSGVLQVVDTSEDGRETGVNVIQPGAFFGELAVLDGQPRSASVVALKQSEAAFLPNAQARTLIFNRPLVAERMLLHFTRAQRALTQQCTLLSIPNAFHRVFAQLQSLVRETPQGKIIDLPKQHEVAIMVNTSRETVSRALHTLIKLNVLEKKGAVLIVRKPAQLKTAAENGLEELAAPKPIAKTGT
ncbi:MAG: Crp/Fnr family transcriptional regulator [Rugosibacter sp.]